MPQAGIGPNHRGADKRPNRAAESRLFCLSGRRGFFAFQISSGNMGIVSIGIHVRVIIKDRFVSDDEIQPFWAAWFKMSRFGNQVTATPVTSAFGSPAMIPSTSSCGQGVGAMRAIHSCSSFAFINDSPKIEDLKN